jgi:hypothetical protein
VEEKRKGKRDEGRKKVVTSSQILMPENVLWCLGLRHRLELVNGFRK